MSHLPLKMYKALQVKSWVQYSYTSLRTCSSRGISLLITSLVSDETKDNHLELNIRSEVQNQCVPSVKHADVHAGHFEQI